MSLRIIKQNIRTEDLDTARNGRQLICDFDGVLMETASAVIAAYREAGARDPYQSQYFHWSQWCSEEIHEKKNEIFVRTCAEKCRLLPLYDYAVANDAVILTSCSEKAFNALKDAFKISLPVLKLGVTKDEKITELVRAGAHGSFYYLDDHIEFCKRVGRTFGFDSVAGVMKTNAIQT